MSNVIYFNERKMEKQYKAAGSEFTYYPELDNVKRPKNTKWTAQSYMKAYIQLNTNLLNKEV